MRFFGMKTLEMGLATMTLAEFLREWPEEALAAEKEILITRDGKPIAKLCAVEKGDTVPQEEDHRPRFNAAEQRKWMEDTWGKGMIFDGQKWLDEDRNDRELI